MTLLEIIKKNRPNLSASSVRTYNSIIKNLSKKLDIEINDYEDVEKHIKHIQDDLKELEPRKRKTIYASLVALFDRDEKHNKTLDKIRASMLDDIKTAEDDDEKLEMSETQKENWLNYDDILDKYKELEKQTKPLLSLTKLTPQQFKQVNLYVLLSCLLLIPPRRSLDYTEFKFNNIDKDNDNYFDKKTKSFIFNKYKTSRSYGTSKVSIPPKLVKIINDWAKINKEDYAFLDSRGNKLNQTKLNSLLNNFFGKKIGTSMLRHIYLSNSLKDIPKEIFKNAKDMGHSVEQAIKYVKKD